MQLKDKTSLITGGSRGIGLATAFLFAKEGARVGIVARKEEHLKKAEIKAQQRGIQITTFVGDVSRKQQVTQVMRDFVGKFGWIDILVNNAGIGISKPFLGKTVQDWQRTLEVNLIGTFLCAQSAARYMLRHGSGKIVNVSSIRGIDYCGREAIMDYSASKGAVISLTKTMAKELAPRINVNAVVPGHTNTEMIKKLPDEIKKNMIEGTYLKRLAEPEEIAKAILFLASDGANFVTGQVLIVDGGFSLK